LNLIVNGVEHTLRVPHDAPLLNALRNDLALNGPKYGCGLGQCGACTVLVDGVAARSCVIPVSGVAGRRVTTLEGLAGSLPADGRVVKLHPVQQAFIDEQAAQCGYCLNGMVMNTAALLARNPHPTEQEARNELSHNLCRCGTHLEILKAVQRAAVLMAQHRADSALQAAARSQAPGDASVDRIAPAQGVSGR
jgi:nicotinate dehydrogenase subunit A